MLQKLAFLEKRGLLPACGLCDQVLLHLDYKDAQIPVGTAQGREKPYQQKKVLCEIKPG